LITEILNKYEREFSSEAALVYSDLVSTGETIWDMSLDAFMGTKAKGTTTAMIS